MPSLDLIGTALGLFYGTGCMMWLALRDESRPLKRSEKAMAVLSMLIWLGCSFVLVRYVHDLGTYTPGALT